MSQGERGDGAGASADLLDDFSNAIRGGFDEPNSREVQTIKRTLLRARLGNCPPLRVTFADTSRSR